MSAPENQDDNLAAELSRRIVARAALRKISALVVTFEEEDRWNAKARRAMPKILLWVLVLILLIFPFFWTAFHSHPKIQAFAGSLIAGCLGAVALILWSKRRGKK